VRKTQGQITLSCYISYLGTPTGTTPKTFATTTVDTVQGNFTDDILQQHENCKRTINMNIWWILLCSTEFCHW